MKNKVALILSVLLIILICIISFIRLGHKNIWQDFYFNCDIVFICAYLLWIILESSVSKKEMEKVIKHMTSEVVNFMRWAYFFQQFSSESVLRKKCCSQ